MTLAWQFGLMHHYDPKKYPKRPEQMWDKGAADQTVNQMKALAMAWASNTDKVLGKGKKPS